MRAVPVLLVILACLPGACRRAAEAPAVEIEWTLTPTPPLVGAAILRIRVLDRDRAPVSGAKLTVEGHMSHPGMAPTLASAIERGHGTYEAEVPFTMRGDWILIVSGSLAGGTAVHYRIDVPDVRPRE